MRGHTPAGKEAWVAWVRAFIQFHHLSHPETMSEPEIGVLLTHLASERGVSLPKQA